MSMDPRKPRLMEITDPDRTLLACMRGDYGPGWYALCWVAGLTLPTLLVVCGISVIGG